MSSYVIVIEQGKKSFGAYVPDLPGCVAVGDSLAEVRELIAGSIKMHLNGMRQDGLRIPEPTSTTRRVYVPKFTVGEPLEIASSGPRATVRKKSSSSITHAKSTANGKRTTFRKNASTRIVSKKTKS